jgi:Fe-S-cluster-containing hydrogenase component 2
MEALKIEGEIVVRDASRYIGCGLCVSACPLGALTMEPREERAVPPWGRRALNTAMMASVKREL